MDRLTDPQVGAAAAKVGDFVFDVRIRGLSLLCEQGNSCHDLTGLTITATRYAAFYPRSLHRMLSAESFDGGNRPACGLIDW
jgi:hypothetical protein